MQDEIVLELATLLLQDEKISMATWDHLAIVAQLRSNTTQVNGFAYRDSGTVAPIAAKDSRVPRKFQELRSTMHEEGRPDWQACLVRIDRKTENMTIDFEYEKPDKWLITPATFKQLAETLRPATS